MKCLNCNSSDQIVASNMCDVSGERPLCRGEDCLYWTEDNCGRDCCKFTGDCDECLNMASIRDALGIKKCTCDDYCDDPCPVHARENQLMKVMVLNPIVKHPKGQEMTLEGGLVEIIRTLQKDVADLQNAKEVVPSLEDNVKRIADALEKIGNVLVRMQSRSWGRDD